MLHFDPEALRLVVAEVKANQYWMLVDSLKTYVNSVLTSFDFSRDHLYFRASW